MYTRKIYVTGGDPRELDEVFHHLPGVTETTVGEILADGEEDTRSGVEIRYNPKKIDLSMLFDILFAVVDPRLPDGQGRTRGLKYCAGIWYSDMEDRPHVELYMNFLRSRGKPPAATGAGLTINDTETGTKNKQPCHAKAGAIKTFTPAPEEDQRYYETHDRAGAFIDFAKLESYLQF